MPRTFPPIGVDPNPYYSGSIATGYNTVCPTGCQLTPGTNVIDTQAFIHGTTPIYNADDINSYYCILNTGPPVPYGQTDPNNRTKINYYEKSPATSWSAGFTRVSGVSPDAYYANFYGAQYEIEKFNEPVDILYHDGCDQYSPPVVIPPSDPLNPIDPPPITPPVVDNPHPSPPDSSYHNRYNYCQGGQQSKTQSTLSWFRLI